MGLSVLIPVYNFNVTVIVQTLSAQLQRSGKEGEIILLDDGSSAETLLANQSLKNIPSIFFFKNEKNEGRMAARQRLADLAHYEHLLFLDCDSEIIKEDFLVSYFNLINENITLASGGRVYNETPPASCEFRLHWKYGRKRESNVGKSETAFQSNNFLIRKEIFKSLDISLQLSGYGHEDSLWGMQFEQAKITCHYINNPVLHASLEKADNYVQKSEQALSNLLLLEKNIDTKLISRHVKIYRWYQRLKRTGLTGIFLFFEKPLHNYFRENLLSCKPRLLYFDCYRLAVLIRKAKAK